MFSYLAWFQSGDEDLFVLNTFSIFKIIDSRFKSSIYFFGYSFESQYLHTKSLHLVQDAQISYDFFGSQYVQRYTSQLIMYVLYTEIGHSVRLRV